MSMVKWVFLAGAMLTVPGQVRADAPMLRDQDLSRTTFPAAADAIRDHLDSVAAEIYSEAQRRRVNAALLKIGQELQSDRRGAESRIKSEQSRVNAILLPVLAADSGDAQVVCRRVKTVGSNIHQTRCLSREQLDRERQAALDTIDRFGGANCVAGSDGRCMSLKNEP